MTTSRCLVALVAVIALASNAQAETQRHWIARIGVHPISSEPHDAPALEASNGVAPSLGATYLFSRHWALELFATLPAELTLRRFDSIGTFDLSPASLTTQYHISDAAGRVRAFVGVGIAYTRVAEERAVDTDAFPALRLSDTTGVTAVAGLDMNLGSRWFATVDARWFDIDSRVSVAGVAQGTVQIDPFAFGLSLGRRLR